MFDKTPIAPDGPADRGMFSGKRKRRSWMTLSAAGLAVLVAVPLTIAQSSASDEPSGSDDRPVIWTSDQDIEDAKQRVANEEDPYYESWVRTQEHADNALNDEDALNPYHGRDESEESDDYFELGRDQAKQTRSMALAYRVSGEEKYLEGAREWLRAWAHNAAATEDHREDYPEFDVFPASNMPHGTGLRIGRVMSTFADAYALVWDDLSASERDEIDEWMLSLLPAVEESQRIWKEGSVGDNEPPWLGENKFNNHLSAHILGMAAIGYATQDQDLIDHALRGPDNPKTLEGMIEGSILMTGDKTYRGDPDHEDALPGEIWDRYRVADKPTPRGLLYSLTHIRFLALTVEMTHNNDGEDYYQYQAEGGENLEVAFQRYSPWFVTGDPDTVNNGYYSDAENYERLGPEISTWELAGRHYPDNADINEALSAHERLIFDAETWGWSAPLTNGPPLN